MKYRRICITRCGYAMVPGDTDEQALEAAKNLSQHDFDWERVNPELIEATAEIIETVDTDKQT